MLACPGNLPLQGLAANTRLYRVPSMVPNGPQSYGGRERSAKLENGLVDGRLDVTTMLPRILIVDDNSAIRGRVRKLFESFPGWLVCGEAVNGQQGIETAQKLKPNVIILDLSMPVMNGLEAAKVLSENLPSIPLIMFTSFITCQVEQEAIAAGVRQVIAKDKPVSDLVNAVKSLVVTEAA
jgi:CheY-like chemotaxis protein